MAGKGNRGGVYRTIEVTAAAARTAGTFVKESGWTGMVTETVAIGARYALQIEGEVKATLASCAVGDLIYIDPSNVITKTSTSNTLFGKVSAIPDPPYNDLTGNDIWIWLRQA